MKADRWASVSRTEFGHVGEERHIVRFGNPTSACGITALPVGMWRGNSRKPKCPACLAKAPDPATAGSGTPSRQE